MTKNIPEKQTKELTALINEYTVWRKTRKGRTAIPAKLWERTIKLTKYYSVGKLTQILRLNYQKLKNCSQEASQPVIQEKFIEVKSSPGVISPNIIEYENRNGSKLRLNCTPENIIQYNKTIDAFLSL